MIIVENRRAYFDYEIGDTWEAGMSLLGSEVKSVRLKQVRLGGSYVKVLGGNTYLVGAHIANYKNAAQKFDPTRSRRLLLTHQEISRIAGMSSQKGYALIPLKIYTSGSRLKIQIGLGRARKNYDKKDRQQAQDLARDEAREIKELAV